MAIALRGATPAERDAGLEAVLRLCATLAKHGPDAISNARPDTDQFIQLLSPGLASRLQFRLIEISPGFTDATARGTAAGSSQPPSFQEATPTVADPLRRRESMSRPSVPRRPKPPRHSFRVGAWVYNLETRQMAIIKQFLMPRNGPNGPEDMFHVGAADGALLSWCQFEIRLATQEEIEAEQANRKASKEEFQREQEELERERVERRAESQAKWETRRRLRGSCKLFAVAQKRRRKLEMLMGRAWDGGDYVVFEAVDGAIRSRRTYRTKGVATRAYNAAIVTGYTTLDADKERFDRLCSALVEARLVQPRR